MTGWSSYDPATESAAAMAKSLGVDFEVQIGQAGAPVDLALVQNGYWGEDILAIAEHFDATAPDLHYLDTWDEPNNGSFTAANYVTECLELLLPSGATANAAEGAHVLVIGGSVLDMDSTTGRESPPPVASHTWT